MMVEFLPSRPVVGAQSLFAAHLMPAIGMDAQCSSRVPKKGHCVGIPIPGHTVARCITDVQSSAVPSRSKQNPNPLFLGHVHEHDVAPSESMLAVRATFPGRRRTAPPATGSADLAMVRTGTAVVLRTDNVLDATLVAFGINAGRSALMINEAGNPTAHKAKAKANPWFDQLGITHMTPRSLYTVRTFIVSMPYRCAAVRPCEVPGWAEVRGTAGQSQRDQCHVRVGEHVPVMLRHTVSLGSSPQWAHCRCGQHGESNSHEFGVHAQGEADRLGGTTWPESIIEYPCPFWKIFRPDLRAVPSGSTACRRGPRTVEPSEKPGNHTHPPTHTRVNEPIREGPWQQHQSSLATARGKWHRHNTPV